jgi:D-aminoacyl-tRNA deacylase
LKALLQRVNQASVVIDGNEVARIGQGLLVLLCAMPTDTRTQADRLLDKLAKLRVFADANNKMNLSVTDIQGGVLLVPQFTLAGTTQSGTRPSFDAAARPDIALPLFDYACQQIKQRFTSFGFGVFGADMQIGLVNDGPVTLWLEEHRVVN